MNNLCVVISANHAKLFYCNGKYQIVTFINQIIVTILLQYDHDTICNLTETLLT